MRYYFIPGRGVILALRSANARIPARTLVEWLRSLCAWEWDERL